MQMQMSSGNSRCNYLSLWKRIEIHVYRLFNVQLEYHLFNLLPIPGRLPTRPRSSRECNERVHASTHRRHAIESFHFTFHNPQFHMFGIRMHFRFPIPVHKHRGIYYKTHNGITHKTQPILLSHI